MAYFYKESCRIKTTGAAQPKQYKPIESIEQALLLAVPWVLLLVLPLSVFPYVLGKSVAFQCVVATVLGLRVFQIGRWPSKPFPLGVLGVSLSLFLGWSFATSFFGLGMVQSFWSTLERQQGLMQFVCWFSYIGLLATHGQSSTFVRRSFLSFIAAAVVSIIYALFMQSARAGGLLGNPIYLAEQCGYAVLFCVFLQCSISEKTERESTHAKKTRALVAVAIAVFIAGIVASGARGPFLALMLSLLFISAVGWRRIPPKVLLLGAVSCCALVAALYWQPLPLFERLAEISMNDQTTADRLANWRVGMSAGQLLGGSYGLEHYNSAFSEHYLPGVLDAANPRFDRAHNQFIDSWVAGGFISVLTWVLILFFAGALIASNTTLNRSRSDESRVARFALVAVLLFYTLKSLVGFDALVSQIALAPVFAFALCKKQKWQLQIPALSGPLKRINSSVVRKCTAAFLTAMLVYAVFSPLYAGVQLKKAVLLLSTPCMTGAGCVRQLKHADASLSRILMFTPQYSAEAFLAAQHKPVRWANVEAMPVHTPLLLSLAQRALKQNPSNYHVQLELAYLYAQQGDFARAVGLLKELITVSPKHTLYWHALVDICLAEGNVEQAKWALAQLRSLNPKYPELRLLTDAVNTLDGE